MNEQPPIIKIVKKGGHGGHHGGAWKVAYADFVTAMMAFFLVMWILGMSQATRAAIAHYFRDPYGVLKVEYRSKSLNDMPTSAPPPHKVQEDPRHEKRNEKHDEERQKFAKTKEALEQQLDKHPEFKKLENQISIEITKEGLRIELRENPQSPFFQSGSATMKLETNSLLRVIATELKKLPNHVQVEGHTDSVKYPTGDTGYSNWELSSDRANSARRAMVGILRPEQVKEVRGYADTRLKDKEHPNSASNRRVSILMTYQYGDSVPSQEVGTADKLNVIQPKVRQDFRPFPTPNASGHSEEPGQKEKSSSPAPVKKAEHTIEHSDGH